MSQQVDKKMPPESFEAFRGLPRQFITGAVELANGMAPDAEVTLTVSNRSGQRRVNFVFKHGLWLFSGFVRPKSGEIELKEVKWGGQ